MNGEPTDEQIERMARSLFARTQEGRDRFTWPLNPGDRERDLADAHRLLHHVAGTACGNRSTDD